ncbi:T-lymphocyte activation antigen CD86 isoform X1 [Xenopus laevis]|uniref:T-lymphocyte activation antigen CD86 isoform X1 n=1 Tax=Xenopus laevis TaxID=8355 RepID=A0A8J1M6P2_XENLA|nr:T-lymphocyte activation antigen CD86 isoform X1 [Xenopus laevis]
MMQLMKVLLFLGPLTACAQDIPTSTINGAALYGGTVELKCDPSIQNPGIQKETFYWQMQKSSHAEPLFEMKGNVSLAEYVEERYRNRTKLKENFDLYLYNVTIEDEGKYECYIAKEHARWQDIAHKCVFNLKVSANFSPTESHSPPIHNMTRGENKTLECSLAGGYPKPSGLTWTVVNSGGTFTMKENVNISEDAQTKLYNISSTLSVLVDGNTTIFCSILQGDENSDIYNFSILVAENNQSTKAPPTDTKKPVVEVSIYIASGLVLLFLLVTLIAIFLKKRRKRACCTEACNGHTPVRQAEENTEEAPHQEEIIELVDEGHRNGS